MNQQPPAPQPTWEPKVGDILGHYRLVELLAVGGMGMVYKAEDEPLHRYVAIKILAPQLATDQELCQRFLAEARAIATLNHPNTLQVHFVGQHHGVPFIALKLIEGQTLYDLLQKRKQFTVSEAVGYIHQAAIGLQHAQERGVLHCDIKPNNLMVTPAGTVKVTDFGLALHIRHRHIPDATQSNLGTPDYVSPERIRGEPIDQRSDIYSLGATLFHLLAGRQPFIGTTPDEVMQQHLHTPVPPLQKFNPRVPIAINRVVQRAMAKVPAQRYPNYNQLLRDLGKFAMDKSLGQRAAAPAAQPAGRPPPKTVRYTSPPEENGSPIVAFLIVALLTGLGWGAWFLFKAQRSESNPKPELPPVSIQTDLESRASIAFASLKKQADGYLSLHNPGKAIAVYRQWPAEFATTKTTVAVNDEIARIQNEARQAWETMNNSAIALREQHKDTDALTIYDKAIYDFAGIPELTDAARQQRDATRQEQIAYDESRTAARREQAAQFQQLSAPVRTLIVSLEFSKAREEIQRLTGTCPAELRPQLDALQADINHLEALKQSVITHIATRPESPTTWHTQTVTIDGQLTGADNDFLFVRNISASGATADIGLKWSELLPASVLKIFVTHLDANKANEILALGILQYYNALAGQISADDARSTLQTAAALDASQRDLVEHYLRHLDNLDRR